MGKINNEYLDMFIESLTKDIDKWQRISHAAMGYNWIEWHGPEIQTKSGDRLSFANTLNYTGAYINGRLACQLGFWRSINIFSARTRKYITASRRMKRATYLKDTNRYSDYLKKVIGK